MSDQSLPPFAPQGPFAGSNSNTNQDAGTAAFRRRQNGTEYEPAKPDYTKLRKRRQLRFWILGILALGFGVGAASDYMGSGKSNGPAALVGAGIFALIALYFWVRAKRTPVPTQEN